MLRKKRINKQRGIELLRETTHPPITMKLAVEGGLLSPTEHLNHKMSMHVTVYLYYSVIYVDPF